MQRVARHHSLKVALAVIACALLAVLAALAAVWFGLSVASAFSEGEALVHRSRGIGIAAVNQQTSPVGFWVFVGMWSVAGLLSLFLSYRLSQLAFWLVRARPHLEAWLAFRQSSAKR